MSKFDLKRFWVLNTSLNRFTLAFPKRLERDFLKFYNQESFFQVRVSFIIAILFYSSFGILDAILVPEAKEQLWIIRFAILDPYMLLLFVLSYTSKDFFTRFMQPLISFGMIIAGLGVVGMIAIAPAPVSYLYYAGLICIFIYTYAFMRLRFIWATLGGLIIIIGYEFTELFITQPEWPIFVNNNFFFITGNIFGMLAGYFIEYYNRRDYILVKRIESEEKMVIEAFNQAQKERDKVEKERDKIKAILDNIADGVFVVDWDCRIISLNPAAVSISGYRQKDVTGEKYSKILKFVYERSGKPNDKFIPKALESGKITDIDEPTKLIKKDGSRISIDASAAPLMNHAPRAIGAVIVFRDVSREREVERMKSEFVSIASHQLRTPISAVKWLLEIVLKDPGRLTTDQAKAIRDANQSNERMIKLVNDLLNLSRIESGRVVISIGDTDYLALIKGAIKDCTLEAESKKVKVSLKTPSRDLPKINIDGERVREVVKNLLTNAIKYSPAGRSIEISISKVQSSEIERLVKESGSEKMIEEESLESDVAYRARDARRKNVDYFLLTAIKDSGMGIPKRQKEKVFKKFFRADNVVETGLTGTGLGLYISRAIIELSGGKIWFISEEGKGSTFFFTLPI